MVKEEELLKLAENGRTSLENLLSNQIKDDMIWCNFKTEQSLRLILKYRRYDLLKYVSVNNLLRKVGDKRYLDYILQELKKNKDYKNLVMEPFERCNSFDQIVDVYIVYCRNQCLNFLPKITKEQLFEKEKGKIQSGKTLIQIIEDKSIDNPSIITFMMKKFFKNDISVLDKFVDRSELPINTSGDISIIEPQIDFSDNSSSDLYIEYFNKKYYDDYDKLSPYDKRLIDNLCFKLKYRCTPDVIDVVKRSYSSQIAINVKGVRKELNLLYEILDNDETFKIAFGNNSFFDPGADTLNIHSNVISIFNHEMGHVLFHKAAKGKIEEEFTFLADSIKNNNKHLDRIKELSDLYHSESKKTKEKAIKVHDANSVLSENDKRDYDKFILNRERGIRALSKEGVSKEHIERLLKSPCSFEEFKSQKREDRIGKLKYAIMKCDNASIGAVCDIVDAIYLGEFRGSLLKDNKGKTIKPCMGHGLYYYNKDESSRFNEIIANYSLLRKTKDKKAMKMLSYFTSKEFVDYLDVYYNEYIIDATIEKIDERFL